MDQSRPARDLMNGRRGEPGNQPSLFLALASLVIGPIPVLAWLLPAALVLPALSAILFSSAAIVGLLAWLGRAGSSGHDQLTLWDLAGAFAFVGCAAGILSETTSVAHLFGVVMAVP